MAGKRKNFFMVDNRIFEYGLKPRDIAVYCFLCRRMNRESNVAFPSRRDIANGCGIRKEESVAPTVTNWRSSVTSSVGPQTK